MPHTVSSSSPAWRPAVVAVALALLSGCGRPPTPAAPGPRGPAASGPVVVLVPGITGVELRHRDSGRLAWGNGARLFTPRDLGAALALPVAPGVAGEPELVPGGVIERISLLGIVRKSVYGPVLDLLEEAGYRRGDLDRPDPAATLFPFAYDWRRDNVASAAELSRRLQGLRRARGEGPLRVVLICQSNGAHLCRYFAKYGGAAPEEAAAGSAGPPPGVEVEALVLVGTSNGGSLRILREMNRGRRYAPGGRRWAPETLFTFPSLYQDLPAYRSDLFVGPDGRALDVDLYDAAAWRPYGWSIYGRDSARRLASGRLPAAFGDAAAREAFLIRALEGARRLQRLLAADSPGFGATRYHLIQSAYTETPDRALLERTADGWRTSFTGDRRLRRDPYLASLTSAPGDGHATLASQGHLSPQEQAALASEPFYVRGRHFEMILSPATGRRLLEVLRGASADARREDPARTTGR